MCPNMVAVAANDPRTEVRRLLDEWDLSDAWLARRIKETKQNVSNWLAGTSPQDPSVWDRMLEAIPQRVVSDPKIPVAFKQVKMPLAGDVPAGAWGDPLASEEFIELDAKFEHPRRFVCRVVGDSCYPALQQGDLTVWHSDENPPYGVIVLAQRSAEHECTVKQLEYDNALYRPRLMPLNPSYDVPEDQDGWRVVARLVGVIRMVDGLENTWYLPQGIRGRHLT
jgi:SOS-response transcriptional repressor LexA